MWVSDPLSSDVRTSLCITNVSPRLTYSSRTPHVIDLLLNGGPRVPPSPYIKRRNLLKWSSILPFWWTQLRTHPTDYPLGRTTPLKRRPIPCIDRSRSLEYRFGNPWTLPVFTVQLCTLTSRMLCMEVKRTGV